MEWALNEYTYRECCGESIRACDGCDCYECEECGGLNFDLAAPDNDDQCLECYTYLNESDEDS